MNEAAPIVLTPSTITIDHPTAVALYRLVDNVSLVRMIRDNELTPDNVRRCMDFWKALDDAHRAGVIK